MEKIIVYVLHRSNEKVTWVTNSVFKKTQFDNSSFASKYPLPQIFVERYDIDNNNIWGQMSGHIRIFLNLKNIKYNIIGFGQYRRTFRSIHKMRYLFHFPMSKKEIRKKLISKQAIITSYYIPLKNDTVFERFDFFRGGAKQITNLIVKRYPELENTIQLMSNKKGGYWNGPNIIAKRDFLVQYYEMLLPFLFDCYDFFNSPNSKYIIKNRKRYLDFCSELFFAVYFYYQRDNVFETPYIQYNFGLVKHIITKIKRFSGD